MAVNKMETGSDIRSKKRKKSERGNLKKMSETYQEDASEEIPPAPASLEKKRKSKKLKLTVDSTSKSVEVVHEESETSSNSKSFKKKKISEETRALEAGESESTASQENSLASQSKKKKKKEKKFKASSAPESGQSSSNSPVKSTKSEKSKKKKWKKKKSKKKNESTISPSKNESSLNMNPVFRSEKAISYLETWKNDRNKWKFEKLTQFWLCKNMFDDNMIPEATFEILLEYFVDLQGKSKHFVIELCEGIFKKKEEMATVEEEDEVLERAYKRARSIVQCLK